MEDNKFENIIDTAGMILCLVGMGAILVFIAAIGIEIYLN